MEDLIAIKFKDAVTGKGALLTWGRLFDKVDPHITVKGVAIGLRKAGYTQLISMEVCHSLQDVSHEPYFYEGLLEFSWTSWSTSNLTYARWAARTRKRIMAGKEIYLVSCNKRPDRWIFTGKTLSKRIIKKVKEPKKGKNKSLGGYISHGMLGF